MKKTETLKTILIIVLLCICTLEFYIIKNGPIITPQNNEVVIKENEGEIILYEDGGTRDKFFFYIKTKAGMIVRFKVSETTSVFLREEEDFRKHNYYGTVMVISECPATGPGSSWSYLNYPATIVDNCSEE